MNLAPKATPLFKIPMDGHVFPMHLCGTHTPGLPAQKEQKVTNN